MVFALSAGAFYLCNNHGHISGQLLGAYCQHLDHNGSLNNEMSAGRLMLWQRHHQAQAEIIIDAQCDFYKYSSVDVCALLMKTQYGGTSPTDELVLRPSNKTISSLM